MSVLIDESKALEALEPESVRHDASVRAVTAAYAPRVAAVSAHRHDGIKLQRLDELSSCELDHLAAQWHAPSWSDAWPVETKRRTLRSIITELSRTGTAASVKNIIAGFGSAAVLQEWWQTNPQGTPHTFKIYINQGKVSGLVSAEVADEILRMINSTKPVRSQFTLITLMPCEATLTIRPRVTNATCLHLGMALSPAVRRSKTSTLECRITNAAMYRFVAPKAYPESISASASASCRAGGRFMSALRLRMAS